MGTTGSEEDAKVEHEAGATVGELPKLDPNIADPKLPINASNTIIIEDYDEPKTNGSCQTEEPQVQLSDFVGEHGAYQLAITALLFIRYVFLGLMANSGPLMTPDVTFYCNLPMTEILSIMPNISTLSPIEQELEIKEEFKQICHIDLHLYHDQNQLRALNNSSTFRTSPLSKIGSMNLNFTNVIPQSQAPVGPRMRECVDFTYETAKDQGNTMTSEFDLVCDRDWLRSLFQSLLSASIVVAHVFWGTFSDKYGRFQAQRLCLIVSLLAGLMSIFASDFWTFTISRALCSFGDLGLVVSQTTTVVELVGQRYRGSSVALVNFGFALGVSLLPYVMAYFENFRLVTGFTVLCHMLTMPFVLATNESPRWLMTNRKFGAAKRELERIARWNRACASFWESAQFPWFSFGTRNQADSLAEQKQTNSAKRKMSSKQQRQHFEEIFAKFMEQIEAQNLYDPVIQEGSAINATPTPRLSPMVGSRSPPTIIVRQPVSRSSVGRAPLVESRADPGQLQMQPVAGLAEFPGQLFVVDELKPSKDQLARGPALDSSSSASSSSGADLDAFGSEKLMRRAISCSDLEAAAPGAPLKQGPAKQPSPVCRASPDQWKTLTLPVASRSSSIYGEECDDELQRQPIRRGRTANGHSHQHQTDCITSCHIVAHQLSFVGRVSRLFKDKKLMVAVFTIVWTTFNSELLYTSFIIINLEVGEDLYLNYVLGGCMEALAAISASLLLSYSPRRVSLIAFWMLISLSCFGLSLAHIDSTWAVWMLALAKFSQSCLSSIASVAAYESFPTFLRQSGSGLVFTLGMMGSVFAPLIFAEFDDHAGMDRVLMTFSCSSLTAATLIYLFLNETRGCELK